MATKSPDPTVSELRYDIVCIDDEAVPRDVKLRAVDALASAGKPALQPLIERLREPRDSMFLPDTPLEPGPMHAGGRTATAVSVKYMVETILYRIISPLPRPPKLTGKETLTEQMKMRGPPMETPRMAYVDDWTAFWEAHSKASLEEMRYWSYEENDRLIVAIARESAGLPPLPGGKRVTPPARSPTPAFTPTDPAVLEQLRTGYARAQDTLAGAVRDPGTAKDARKALDAIAKANPRLKVHTDHMAAQLPK